MTNRSLFFALLTFLLMASAQEKSGVTDACQLLRPTKADISLPDWLLNEEKNFKRQGCWREHLHYGSKALQEAEQKKQTVVIMKLSLQMASSSFYLGDYVEADRLAEKGYSLAVSLKNNAGQIEGLYLLSAVARTRGNISAVELAEKALHLFRESDINDRSLEGKVYMNLGAALSDIEPGDLVYARQYLQKAYILFLDLNHKQDTLRAGLRLVRVDYLLDQYDRALKFLESLSLLVDDPRSEMLYGYQMAKVLHRLKQWDEAGSYAIKARKLASELNAKKDEERLESLLIAINQRRFVEEPEVETKDK